MHYTSREGYSTIQIFRLTIFPIHSFPNSSIPDGNTSLIILVRIIQSVIVHPIRLIFSIPTKIAGVAFKDQDTPAVVDPYGLELSYAIVGRQVDCPVRIIRGAKRTSYRINTFHGKVIVAIVAIRRDDVRGIKTVYVGIHIANGNADGHGVTLHIETTVVVNPEQKLVLIFVGAILKDGTIRIPGERALHTSFTFRCRKYIALRWHRAPCVDQLQAEVVLYRNKIRIAPI